MTTIVQDQKTIQIRRITYGVVISAIVLIFAFTGILKFTSSESIINNFSKWNLLKWKEVIGAVEILGVILYLIPKTNLIGALLFTGIMAGAIYIHVTFNEPYFFESGIVLVIWINYLFLKPGTRLGSK